MLPTQTLFHPFRFPSHKTDTEYWQHHILFGKVSRRQGEGYLSAWRRSSWFLVQVSPLFGAGLFLWWGPAPLECCRMPFCGASPPAFFGPAPLGRGTCAKPPGDPLRTLTGLWRCCQSCRRGQRGHCGRFRAATGLWRRCQSCRGGWRGPCGRFRAATGLWRGGQSCRRGWEELCSRICVATGLSTP